MRRYPAGVPAGEIATALDFKPNTASAYLATLKQADLIRQERQGTSLLYFANLDGVRGLFDGLLTGCCQNRPDICHSLASAPIAQPTPERPLKVLFLCTGNSARSILLESLLNRLGDGRIHAFSAGSNPTGKVHPQSLTLLREKGYPVDQARSKSWDEFAAPDAPKMDLVITVCASAAGETCPIWPGAPVRAHWGVEDPAAAAEADWASAFLAAYVALERRAKAYLDLPQDLDKDALQTELRRIGEMS